MFLNRKWVLQDTRTAVVDHIIKCTRARYPISYNQNSKFNKKGKLTVNCRRLELLKSDNIRSLRFFFIDWIQILTRTFTFQTKSLVWLRCPSIVQGLIEGKGSDLRTWHGLWAQVTIWLCRISKRGCETGRRRLHRWRRSWGGDNRDCKNWSWVMRGEERCGRKE